MYYPVSHQWDIFFFQNNKKIWINYASGLCSPTSTPLEDTVLCCSFQEGGVPRSGSPHAHVCVAGVVPFCTLSQHRSRMKCPGVGRSIPKPAGGGSVIPKLISSLLLYVSNCECHIFNHAAFQCGFKLFCSSKESFLLFQPIFLQPAYKVSTLCLKTAAVIVIYLWPVSDALWFRLSTHTRFLVGCCTQQLSFKTAAPFVCADLWTPTHPHTHTHTSCDSCAVLLALLKFGFPLCAVKEDLGF